MIALLLSVAVVLAATTSGETGRAISGVAAGVGGAIVVIVAMVRWSYRRQWAVFLGVIALQTLLLVVVSQASRHGTRARASFGCRIGHPDAVMGLERGQVWRSLVGVAGRAVLASSSVALVAGCGGSDGSEGGVSAGGGGGGDAATVLVDRLPEEARQVAAIDVAAVRRGLGLPDDQAIGDLSGNGVQQLAFALGTAVPFLAIPQVTPIREAFDTGAMTAAASVPYAFAPERAVVVVRTSQSFDELAAALADQGYERDGELVVTERSVVEMGGVTVVAAAGDDLIVLAQSAEVARAVAAGEDDGPALADQLDAVDGPLRVAFATAADSDSCVETLAAGWQVDPAEGEIAITVAEPDDAGGLELLPGDSRIARNVDLDPPQVGGRTVMARYRYVGPGSPLSFLFSDLPAGDLYRCP
jgi:hypothetical protein